MLCKEAFSKVGLEETPQQRLWGIENLIKSLLTSLIISLKAYIYCTYL